MSSFLSSRGAIYPLAQMLLAIPPLPPVRPANVWKPHYTKAGPGRVPRIGSGKRHEVQAGRMIRKGYR